jgi:hypothetical protein
MAEKKSFGPAMASGASTVVELLATDPEIKDSYPATAWH